MVACFSYIAIVGLKVDFHEVKNLVFGNNVVHDHIFTRSHLYFVFIDANVIRFFF